MSCHTVTTPKAILDFIITDRAVSMTVRHIDTTFDGLYEVKCVDFQIQHMHIDRRVLWPKAINFAGSCSNNSITFDSNTERDTWLQQAEAALHEWAQNWEGFGEKPKPKRYKVLKELPQMLAGTIVEEVLCHGIRGYTAVDSNSTLPDGTPYRGLLTAHYVEGNYTWFKEVKDEADPCASCREGRRCISLLNSTWDCYQCGQEIREVVTCHVCHRSSDGVTRRSHQTFCPGRVTVKTISVP